MKKDVFLRELEEIFLLDENTIKEDVTLAEMDVDSTGMLQLVAFLAGELGLAADIDAIREIRTVRDIVAMAGDKIE